MLTQLALHVIRGFRLQFSLKGILQPFEIIPNAISDHFASGGDLRVSHTMRFYFSILHAIAIPILHFAKRNFIPFRAETKGRKLVKLPIQVM